MNANDFFLRAFGREATINIKTEIEEDEIIKEISLGIAEFDTINPILSNNKYVQEISRIIYDPLFELNEEYKLQKCLVKDWAKTSETTYLLKLRDDIKWSDEQKFTADDVIYTIDVLKQTPSIYAYNVQYVIRADKIDEQTLQITLEHEIPFFEYNLIFPIMSKTYYEGQDAQLTVVANIAYEFVSWMTQTSKPITSEEYPNVHVVGNVLKVIDI